MYQKPSFLSNSFGELIVLAIFLLNSAAFANEGFEFFESKIRPIFVEHCYKCHSHDAEKIKGGLVLDSRAGLLQGGDSGPAIIPGDPERSLLVKAVRYTDDQLKMPPKNQKLADAQIATLEEWVKMGAPDPRENKSVASPDKEAARKHWAFQPLTHHRIPPAKNKWAKTPIDKFILVKLEEKKLKPSPSADKRTLIRRVTIDLTGLPPSFEEIERFSRDKSSDAFAKVVDRLLASPRYGERWGRYWLDVARFGDTKGYVYGGEETRTVHSHVYRDWVIQSLNADMPYDQFILQQIAADQLDVNGRPLTIQNAGPIPNPSLAAMGFLTLGKRFLGVQHDIIDDRIDVVSRGLLGLTVSCARCHDHKFDPIPTKDYYSLYGVFAGSTEKTFSLAANPNKTENYLNFEKGFTERVQKFEGTFQTNRAEMTDRLRKKADAYLLAVLDAKKLPGDDFVQILQPDDVNPQVVRDWQNYLFETRNAFHPVFAPWSELLDLPPKDFTLHSANVLAKFTTNSGPKVNPLVLNVLAVSPLKSMRDVAERYGKLLLEIDQKWRDAIKIATDNKAEPLASLSNADEESIRQILYGKNAIARVPPGSINDLEFFLDEPTWRNLKKLQAEIDRWIIESPGAPPHSVILEDRSSQREPRVFIRGNPANKGDAVPRQFLEILSSKTRQPFSQGSGRLELAQAIAAKNNPLTARVMVNRIWQHHFGAGLVRTPSDFGTRSEPPTHPELLDWLANSFMENNWSLKKLHRLILLSAVYQQASVASPNEIDPENKLLWHYNAQRLDFEALRDSLLFVSGDLDWKSGGKAEEMFKAPYSKRRSIYGFIDRQFLPGTMRIFDFANPDMHAPQRSETTVPQQALFFMNDPFMAERTKSLMTRVTDFTACNTGIQKKKKLVTMNPRQKTAEEKISELYRLVFQREPTRAQIQQGVEFIRSTSTAVSNKIEPEKKGIDWKYGFGEYDENGKKLNGFAALPNFTGEAWQGGMKWPDDKLGWLQLTATGGHAGNDLKHAIVRRWVSPVDGAISIEGMLKHERVPGDGIRAYIFSSRHGELGRWRLHNQNAETRAENLEVKKGDTLDFIVSIHTTLNNNDFVWAPVIRMTGPNAIRDANGYAREWNAQKEFAGPALEIFEPLDPWQRYAQVLLLSNEFLFVD